VELDVPLRRIVARLAQRLKRPEPKSVDVTTMPLDVIANGCHTDAADLEAVFAERVF
jgi:hypothetical protein